MTYTQAQQTSLYVAKKRHLSSGRPEMVARINAMMADEAPYDEIWKLASSDVREMVKPEKPAEVIEPPPYVGKGSGTAVWQEFALKVSDMDEEVIFSMGRNDIVTVLTDKGIIKGPDYDLQTTTKSSDSSSD